MSDIHIHILTPFHNELELKDLAVKCVNPTGNELLQKMECLLHLLRDQHPPISGGNPITIASQGIKIECLQCKSINYFIEGHLCDSNKKLILTPGTRTRPNFVKSDLYAELN